MKNGIGTLTALACILVIASFPASARKPYLDMEGETSHDGLYRVKRSIMDYAWARPDVNLGDYDKLMLMSAGLQYRPVKSASRNSDLTGR